MRPSEALQVALHVLRGGNSPFFIGSVGVGKSYVAYGLCNILANGLEVVRDEINPSDSQYGFIDIRLSLLESIDLGGLPFLGKNNEQKRAFLGNLPTGGKGLLLFDEYSQAHSSVQAVCGQLLYERRIGEYLLPDGWQIICCGNRQTDRAGSNKLPTHVVGRCSIIDFDVSLEDWIEWAINNGVHPQVIGFIQMMPQGLWEFDSKLATPQANPRSWTRLSDTLKTDPPKAIRNATMFATDVGEHWAIEFDNFLYLSEEIPSIDEIMKNPEKAELPSGGSYHKKKKSGDVNVGGITYATIVALTTTVNNATKAKVFKYFESSLTYIQRLPSPELGVFFVRQTTAQRPELKETKSFISYKVKNSDIETL